MSGFAYRTFADGDDLEAYLVATRIEIGFAAPTLICAALAAAVVLKITSFQTRGARGGETARVAPIP